MRALTVVASLVFLSLAARPARAQACCGRLVAYPVNCGACGDTHIYSCLQGSGNSYNVPVYVNCGSDCYTIQEYAPAGYCYNGVSSPASPTQNAAGRRGEASIYVNAYIRDCRGRYVAVRLPMARQEG